MSTKDDEFLRQLRATFKVEADEHLQAIETGLLNLEKTPASSDLQRDIVEKVFRAAHSLKGAARAVDLGEVESHCQRLEEVLASWKRRETVPTPEALDKLHRILVAVKANLSAPAAAAGADMKAQVSPRRPPPAPGASPRPASASVVADQPTAAIADHPASAETVRVPVAKLEARLLESEELLAAKLAAAQRVTDLRQLSGRLEDW
ncbi:MAG TPA: Hpt domain-containing protein, partial [Burkholderiales bacterium]